MQLLLKYSTIYVVKLTPFFFAQKIKEGGDGKVKALGDNDDFRGQKIDANFGVFG